MLLKALVIMPLVITTLGLKGDISIARNLNNNFYIVIKAQL